jgi:DnaJ-class molecular chaperone
MKNMKQREESIMCKVCKGEGQIKYPDGNSGYNDICFNCGGRGYVDKNDMMLATEDALH